MAVLDFLNRSRKVQSSRRTFRTENNVVEITGPIATPGGTRAILDAAIASGLKRAIDNMADDIRARAPSSEETGTRAKWSKDTRAINERRPTLRDGVRTSISEDEDGNPVGEIFFDPEVEYIAQFVEFGHAANFWGNKTTSDMPPQPFMRPSYESGRFDLEHDTAAGTREKID